MNLFSIKENISIEKRIAITPEIAKKYISLGLKVFADKIPIAEETKKTSKELNLDPIVCALHGGEDYELLFTLSLKNYEAIKDNSAFSAIGHTTRDSDRVELFTGENGSINLKEDGWDPFRKK